MNCPKCGRRCRCLDSRPRLTYGLVGVDLMADKDAVRERKYACKRCRQTYYTQEYLARTVGDRSMGDRRLAIKSSSSSTRS